MKHYNRNRNSFRYKAHRAINHLLWETDITPYIKEIFAAIGVFVMILLATVFGLLFA